MPSRMLPACSMLLLATGGLSGAEACQQPGMVIQWQADYCLLTSETDDLSDPGFVGKVVGQDAVDKTTDNLQPCC